MAARARHVDKWVTEGIISRDQAESICAYERQVTPSRVTAFEALAYAGAAVAAGITFGMVADVWHQQARVARTATVGITAVSLLTAGITAASGASPPVNRLGKVTLFLAVPAIGVTVNLASGTGASTSESTLMASIAAWMVAALLYGWRRSVPQHVAFFLATVGLVVSLSMYPFVAVPGTLPSLVVYVVGMGWAIAASTGRIIPRLTGEIMGAVASLVGSMVFIIGVDTGLTGLLVGAVVMSVGTVAFGVSRSRVVLTVVGVVALASYVPWLASQTLGPSFGAPAIIAGTAMTVSVWATHKSKKT